MIVFMCMCKVRAKSLHKHNVTRQQINPQNFHFVTNIKCFSQTNAVHQLTHNRRIYQKRIEVQIRITHSPFYIYRYYNRVRRLSMSV